MYLPKPLGVLLLYQNPIMLKQYPLGMTGLEYGLGSVLMLGQVVRTEAVTKSVVRPFLKTQFFLRMFRMTSQRCSTFTIFSSLQLSWPNVPRANQAAAFSLMLIIRRRRVFVLAPPKLILLFARLMSLGSTFSASDGLNPQKASG